MSDPKRAPMASECGRVDLVDQWHRDDSWGGTPVICTRPAVCVDRKMRHCIEHAMRRMVRGWLSERELHQLEAAVRRWPAPVEDGTES